MMRHTYLLRTPRWSRLLVAAALAVVIAGPALAQEWKPGKPVKLLVGFAPGGSADLLARLLQSPLSQALGVPVIVENVTGAGGNIAADKLAKSAPDGYTIGISAAGSMMISPELHGDKLPYRSEDFTPITLLALQPNVVIVNPQVPAKTMAEFVEWVKATPKAAYGTAGVGTSNHLTAEMMLHRYGLKMGHAPYRGASPVIADLIGGHIAMTVDNITTAASLVKEGKVRALAVTTAKRAPQLPNVPTLAESGLKGFDLATWQGMFAPRALPKPTLERLNKELVKALNDPEVRRRMAELGSEPAGNTPEQFAAYLVQERKKWVDVIKTANVKLE